MIVNGKLGSGEEDLLTRFGSVSGPENAGIVLVQVKNSVAQAWFAAAGQVAGGACRTRSIPRANRNRLRSRHWFTSDHDVNIETTRATVNNVLAYLPGKTDEYVIIGAHYDHLGYGNYDSLAPSQIGQIHPGADDNASGTAGVLELARLFAPLKGQLPRGILFASFAGEELGLLGSAEWVKEPTRPLDKAVAMINMDMIGRIQGRKGLHRRRRDRIDLPDDSHGRARRDFRFPHRKFGRRIRLERPHLIRREENSRAFLFLRAAFGLSQAFGHMG